MTTQENLSKHGSRMRMQKAQGVYNKYKIKGHCRLMKVSLSVFGTQRNKYQFVLPYASGGTWIQTKILLQQNDWKAGKPANHLGINIQDDGKPNEPPQIIHFRNWPYILQLRPKFLVVSCIVTTSTNCPRSSLCRKLSAILNTSSFLSEIEN